MDYITELDLKPEYKPYELDNYEVQVMKESLKLIPESYKQILNDKLIGIYFIENFWGT